jgi:hypothetical protein
VDVAVADDNGGEPIHLFHNRGDGTFDRVTEGLLANDPITPFALAWADQDNDGNLDLFAGTFQPSAPNAFYRNGGGGAFTKVTEGAWVNTPGNTTSASWADYDNDGFIDLYVGNWGSPEGEKNFLYHNRGDGTMESIQNALTEFADTSAGPLWTDYDRDGDLDLFIGGRGNPQYRNDGAGMFTLVPPAEGGIPWESDGVRLIGSCSSANYDNDRNLDVLLVTWYTEPSIRLYTNESNGRRFLDTTHRLPPTGSIDGLNACWGDYDNDGFEDLYVTNHGGRNLLYHNEGEGTFKQVTSSPLTQDGGPAFACSWVDYDNDGDLDLMFSSGMWSEFEDTCHLYRNEGNSNHWIALTLEGTVSNRTAVGAKVWAITRINDQNQSQLREIHGGGSDPRAHFGLGSATTIDTLRIEWPSGIVQEFHDVAADQFLTITESAPAEGVAGPMRASPAYTFSRHTEGPLVENKGKFVGGTWGDFDGDGDLDVVVSENDGTDGSILLYRNDRNGNFIPLPDRIPLTDPTGVFYASWTDPDNDGDLDLYITIDALRADLFYRNNGNGTFTRETEGAWLNTAGRTHAANWGDFDNDGWLDLFVADSNETDPQPNRLYRNQGDGTLIPVENVATQIPGVSHNALWSDYDNDGDVDLFVPGQNPVQFRNEGNGDFTGLSPALGGIPEYTQDVDVGFSTADFDNDGDLDVAYTVWSSGPGILLYRNELRHFFVEGTHVLPHEGAVRGLSASWGDYDNDGYLDLFITNVIGKNLLYHNKGDGSFSLVTESPIVSEAWRSFSGAWVDYDNDGDLDLFVTNGWLDKFGQTCELFRNEGGPNHWIILALEGTISNRLGIGAKVWVRTRINGREVDQLREVQSPCNGQNDAGGYRVHFGLGDATVVDTLRIEWPSGIVQEFHDVAADQFLTITESAESEEEGATARTPPADTFTRITEGPLVEDTGNFANLSWADIEGDGDLDVVVCEDGRERIGPSASTKTTAMGPSTGSRRASSSTIQSEGSTRDGRIRTTTATSISSLLPSGMPPMHSTVTKRRETLSE